MSSPLLLHGARRALWATCRAGYIVWTWPWWEPDPRTVWWCLWGRRWWTTSHRPETTRRLRTSVKNKNYIVVGRSSSTLRTICGNHSPTCGHLSLGFMFNFASYHHFSFVRASSASALSWKHSHLFTDAPFGDHGLLDGSFSKGQTDPVIFKGEL